MAEAPGWTAHRTGAGGPDVLLATKLNVPSLRPGFVPRPRLLGRMDEGVARELTLVCAPAGFGKTAMLADWAHRGARSVAGWRWTPVTTIRPGFGGMLRPRWTGYGPGSPSGWFRCSVRRHRR